MSFVKFPPPRPLTKKETLDSLEHWKSQFKTFFKRDDTFRPFLRSDFIWYPTLDKYGFTEANAQEDSDNFEDFLNDSCPTRISLQGSLKTLNVGRTFGM